MGDVLAEVSGIRSRAMFGGYGLYRNGVIFGIIAESRLYFKVGETNQADYEARGMGPFTYATPKGKKYAMSYFQVPEEVMEDREEIERWVVKAVGASLEAKGKKSKK